MRDLELIYAGVNPRKTGELEAFRERAALYSQVYKKRVYKTWSLGDGGEAVVFLPGGMAHGEVWFPQMLALRNTRRTIAFSLPECKTLDEAAEGILFTLEQMEARRAVVAGYSLGGLVAQLMVRREPSRVAGLLLCLTGAPVRALPAEVTAKWAERRKARFHAAMMNWNNATRMAMAERVFRSNCPAGMETELDFWRAFIEDSYCNHIYQKQYVNLNYLAQPALYRQGPLAPGDLGDWAGEVSILHSGDDPLYAPETPYLLELYPGAKQVDLGSGGQFAMLSRGGTVAAQVEALADACFSPKPIR